MKFIIGLFFYSSIMMNIKIRKFRAKQDQILLEGTRLIQDALEAGVHPDMLIFSKIDDVKDLPLPDDIKLYKVPYRSIQLWSSLTTSPGIMGKSFNLSINFYV